MLLRNLNDTNVDCNVVLLQTPSERMKMFIEDNIKRRYKVNSDTILQCSSKKDYKPIKDIINVVPPFSDKWFIDVDLDKCNDKDFIQIMKDATTCVFFCRVSKYSTFKNVKESLRTVSGVYDFYINYLRKPDFIYLYDAFVPSDKRLVKSLFDYVVQSYSGDIEAVFKLLLELNAGKEFNKRSEIADLCGVGGNTVESFIISLLKSPPRTEKGLNTVIKNRLKAGSELAEVYSYGLFYSMLRKTLLNFIQIKVLMVSGVVYKRISNLPDGYNDKVLGRYQRYLWVFREVPLSRILRLYQSLGDNYWSSEIDFLNFLYKYMYTEVKINVSNS